MDDQAFRARLKAEIQSLLDDAQALLDKGEAPLEAASKALTARLAAPGGRRCRDRDAIAVTPLEPSALTPPIH